MERIPPPLEHRAQVVLCLSTGHGPGCGHPVDWHTGPGTVAPDCDCCSWRKNAPPAQVPEAVERKREMRALRAEVEAIHAGRRDPVRYAPNRAERRAAKRGRK